MSAEGAQAFEIGQRMRLAVLELVAEDQSLEALTDAE
jgi:hypothetical protein